jgi:malonyl-CoA/methylmalonyl-CoA synthetase
MNSTRVAIVDPTGTYSYEDLDATSRRVALGLLDGADDLNQARVAFLVTPGFEYAAVQRGIWRAGGVAVPLAVSYPPAELDYIIRDSAAAVVAAGAAYVETLAPLAAAAGARLVTTAELTGERVADDREAAHRTGARPLPYLGAPRRAMIVYTSGTTGRPKGAVSTHANVGAQVSSLVEAWGWTPSDRLLLVLPMHHVHGIINGLGSALAVGATVEFLPTFDAEAVWRRLASGEITVFTAVPTIYHRLIGAWDAAPAAAQRSWSDGARRLRLMMSGSAALPVHTLERWRALTGHTLLERYGMTEIGMALSNPLEGPRRPGFVGTPLPGVEVRLVDESGAPVADGPGEVEVRGPNVFPEYWQRPEETAQAFRDGWFRTGDVAVVEEGAYRLLGRTSVDIIKTGGYKVSALEIEEVLRTHPAIGECAVVGVCDPEWGERVSAAVELRPNATLSLDELQRWAKAVLAPYKVPRALQPVTALPRNAMGKVVKPEVAALFLS